MGRDRYVLFLVASMLSAALFNCLPSGSPYRIVGHPWSDFRGGGGNPGSRDFVLIPEGSAPELEAEVLLGSGVTSPVTGGNGMLYAGTMNGTLYGIDTELERVVWSRELGGTIEAAPLLLFNGSHVVCATSEGIVAMVHALSGNMAWKWMTPTGSGVFSSPKEHSGSIYFGSYDSTFYCLNAENGTVRWSYPGCEGWIHTTPALTYIDDTPVVLFGACDGTMNCLDALSGEVIWRFRTAYIPSSPSVSNGKVFFGCYDSKLFCLDLFDGSEHWNASMPRDVYSSPAVLYEKVAVGCNDGHIYMLNSMNGTVVWSRKMTDGTLESSPVLFRDVVAVTTGDGMFLLDAGNGTVRNGFELGDASEVSPTYVDGRLVFGDSYGWVRTIKIGMSNDNGGNDDPDRIGRYFIYFVIGLIAIVIICIMIAAYFLKSMAAAISLKRSLEMTDERN